MVHTVHHRDGTVHIPKEKEHIMSNNGSLLLRILYVVALIIAFPFAVVFDVMKRS